MEDGERTLTEVWLEPQVQEAARLIREVYSPHLAGSPPVVARSPDRAMATDRRSPVATEVGDLRSEPVARSGDRATTPPLTPQELTKALEAALDAHRSTPIVLDANPDDVLRLLLERENSELRTGQREGKGPVN